MKEELINVVPISAILIQPMSPDYDRKGLKVIERMARTCYRSSESEESRDSFIMKLVKAGHESVIEHVSASFMLTVPRSISHQIVRHRIGVAYSQESQRYCNYSKEPVDVIAPVPEIHGIVFKDWKDACIEAVKSYRKLIASGVEPQRARSVLPESTATRLGMTANLRAWRHILKERFFNQRADPAICNVMGIVANYLERMYPPVFAPETFK